VHKVEAGKRLLVTRELEQREPAPDRRVRRARIEFQRVLETEGGFVVAAGLRQRVADVGPDFRVLGRKRQRLVVGLERLVEAPQPVQGCAKVLQIVESWTSPERAR